MVVTQSQPKKFSGMNALVREKRVRYSIVSTLGNDHGEGMKNADASVPH